MPMARRLRRRHLEPDCRTHVHVPFHRDAHVVQRMQSDRGGRVRAFLQPTSAELT
jgi:hypothetical protein